MRRTRPARHFLLAALPVHLATLSVVATAGAADAQVLVYRDADFSGSSESFRGSVPDFGDTSIGNDRASSIVVPRGCEVTLYRDVGFRGRTMTVRGGTSIRNLDGTPIGNDALSSMHVSCRGGGPGPDDGWGVVLYRDIDFRGERQAFARDLDDLDRSRVGNDRASSIDVPRGCRATLYADVGYRGPRIDLRGPSSVRDLGRTPVGNDRASSLRVRCR